MHDELVKRLREEASSWCINCCYRAGECICGAPDDRKKDCDIAFKLQAADAIEELSKLIDAQLDIIKQYQAYLNKSHWIPVTERLPEDRQSVLVHRDDGGIFIFEYFTTSPTDECWIDDHLNVYSAYCITHWMPLPQPPKEEKDKND